MRTASFAVLAGLVACAPAATTPPAPLVRASVAPEVAANAAGEARIPVSAVARSATGALDPVAASCTAEGQGFDAAFTAPAELAIPAFGPTSGEVTIRCADGARTGLAVARPETRRDNGLAGWPAVGVGVSSGGGSYVSVGGFWNGGWGTGPQTVSVRYPAVTVAID